MSSKYSRLHSEIIRDEVSLARLVRKMKKISEFAYDTETNSLRANGLNKDFRVIGIAISWGRYNNYYIPIGHRFDDHQLSPNTVVKYLKPIFERKDIRLIGWNLKFDMHVLARLGINVKTKDLFDGMIASWLCNENEDNGLKENAIRILKVDPSKFNEITNTVTKEEKKSVGLPANAKATFDLVKIDVGAPYALDDAYYTWELYLYYLDKLAEEGLEKNYWKVYPKFLRCLYKMEERGVAVDLNRLKLMKEEMQGDLDQLQYEIFEIAGVEFNPASSQQLAELLFGFDGSKVYKHDKKTGMQVPVYKNPNKHLLAVSFGFKILSRTNTGAPSTSSDVLENLSKMEFKTRRKREGVELVTKLLVYKKILKLKTSFVDGLLEQIYDDGKIHCNFNIVGTVSGRISCSEPNLQQLPKSLEEDEEGIYELVMKYKIRDIFIGSIDEKTGKRMKILAFDFKNLEMMLLAHFSKDPELIDTFTSGGDAHNSTAKKMFNLDCDVSEVKKLYPVLRQVAKTINFGLMYGMGAFRLYNTLKSYGVDLGDEEHLKKFKASSGEEVAQAYIDMYFKAYAGVAEFIKNQKKFAHRKEYVYTIVGRKRRLPDINGRDYKMVAYEERLAVNAPIQGSAGDVTMNAQIRIDEDPDLESYYRCRMLIQVHDELVFECPEENIEEVIPIITHYMQNPFGDNVKLNVPLIAEAGYGNTYEEAK